MNFDSLMRQELDQQVQKADCKTQPDALGDVKNVAPRLHQEGAADQSGSDAKQACGHCMHRCRIRNRCPQTADRRKAHVSQNTQTTTAEGWDKGLVLIAHTGAINRSDKQHRNTEWQRPWTYQSCHDQQHHNHAKKHAPKTGSQRIAASVQIA